MLKAITRAVSRNIGRCELTFRRRECVDYDKARGQHEAYCHLLRRLGVEVLNLEACDALPDCCFVADTAVMLDELAVIASMGAPSRRGEISAVEKILSLHHQISRIEPPATLDGGDVVRLGKELFVGCSSRTNAEGIESLTRIVQPFGYLVTPVAVTGSLHLTTGCSALDEETVLVNPCWIDDRPFKRFRVLRAFEEEPWAASTMRVGTRVCVEAHSPRTLQMVARHAVADVEVLDISEFRKAEGSLSCLSILFHDTSTGESPKDKEVTHAE